MGALSLPLSFCLSLPLSLCLCLFPSFTSISLPLSLCLYLCVPLYVSVRLSLSLSLSLCHSSLSVSLLLSVCLSVSLWLNLSVSRSTRMSFQHVGTATYRSRTEHMALTGQKIRRRSSFECVAFAAATQVNLSLFVLFLLLLINCKRHQGKK